MPFSFLMMSLLGAGALAATLAVIPLIVHLLHRQKVTPVAWGAMQFLLESPLRVRRRRKIDNWLLMLVRMAILVLLAFLLCRPVWKTSALATSSPVDVAIVIDHSLTMGMRSSGADTLGQGGADALVGRGGGGTLFDQGLDLAQRVSQMLPSSGTMSIVLAEHSPRIITPTPIKMGLAERAADGTPRGPWAAQLQILRALKPGMAKGDIPAAVSAARELLSHGSNTRKLILIVSDDQRTNWNPGDEKAWSAALGHIDVSSDRPGAIPVFNVPLKGIGAAHLSNVTVRSVNVLPEFLGVHRPAQIVATISNSGSTDLANIPLALEVDGKTVLSRPISALAVGESTTVRFDYYFPDAGSHWVRVRADLVDALEADNAATAAVNVKPTLPVLVVDGQLTKPADSVGVGRTALDSSGTSFPQAAFLLAAMQPVDPTIDPVTLIHPTVISAGDLASLQGVRLEDFPIIVLNDVPRLTGDLVDRLAAHAQAGNGVWIILGPRTEESFINDILAHHFLIPITTTGIAHPPTTPPEPNPGIALSPWVTIDIKEPANRAVTLLTHAGEAEHSALADVVLRAWWSVTPTLPDTRTILATTTGDPLVLETPMGKLGGLAVIWATSVGNFGSGAWNNLALVPNFVPLVNETLFNLASGQDAGQPRQVEAGQPLLWTGPINQPIDSVQLLCPDTSTKTLNPEIRGNHYYVEERDTALPGLYEMRFSAPAKAGATAPPTAYFSVNIDPDELDPAVLDPSDLDWFKGHDFLKGVVSLSAGMSGADAPVGGPGLATGTLTLAQAMQATRGDKDFWPWLGILLLIFLVVEVAMTFFLVRQQAGKTLEDENLESVMPKGSVQSGNA